MVIGSSYIVNSAFASKMDGSKPHFEQNILFKPGSDQQHIYESWASTRYCTTISGGTEHKP